MKHRCYLQSVRCKWFLGPEEPSQMQIRNISNETQIYLQSVKCKLFLGPEKPCHMQIRNIANETHILSLVNKMQMICRAWETMSNACID